MPIHIPGVPISLPPFNRKSNLCSETSVEVPLTLSPWEHGGKRGTPSIWSEDPESLREPLLHRKAVQLVQWCSPARTRRGQSAAWQGRCPTAEFVRGGGPWRILAEEKESNPQSLCQRRALPLASRDGEPVVPEECPGKEWPPGCAPPPPAGPLWICRGEGAVGGGGGSLDALGFAPQTKRKGVAALALGGG